MPSWSPPRTASPKTAKLETSGSAPQSAIVRRSECLQREPSTGILQMRGDARSGASRIPCPVKFPIKCPIRDTVNARISPGTERPDPEWHSPSTRRERRVDRSAATRAVFYRHIRVVGRLWLWPNASRPTVFLCSGARGVSARICRAVRVVTGRRLGVSGGQAAVG